MPAAGELPSSLIALSACDVTGPAIELRKVPLKVSQPTLGVVGCDGGHDQDWAPPKSHSHPWAMAEGRVAGQTVT